jgi:glucan phosphoethanolaminetransferase (alkaline phosphatase superfamily)
MQLPQSENPKRRSYGVYLLGMLYLAPVMIMLLWSWHFYKSRSLVTIFLAAVLETALIAACARTWRLFFLVHFPLFVLTLAYAVYTVDFGILPGRGLALLIVTTSWEEITGAFVVSGQKWLSVTFAALAAGYLAVAWRLPRTPIFSGKSFIAARVLLVLSVPLAAYAAHDPAELIDGMALNPAVGSVMFIGIRLPEALNHSEGRDVHKIPYHAHRVTSGEEVHVLIVGESARRRSWSVYGYERPTTPYLERLKHEAIFLTDMYSDANLTTWAVPILLTGLTPAQITNTPITGNLFDLAKEAGYSTAWLVNQDTNVSDSIGIEPDRLVSHPRGPATGFGSTLLDGTLLPAYRRELARSGQSRFIGMHIMESHWEYYNRYPPAFQRFGKSAKLNSMSLFLNTREMSAQLRDAYDNSVLYTDWFLQQVIEAARKLNVPATVVFVPDHGEGLAALDPGFTGHGDTHYAPAQFEIPAFVWVNGFYKEAHPQLVAALEHNAAKEIRSHNVFFTMATLMGITWPGERADWSFASDNFIPDTTRQYLAGGVLVTLPAQPER